MSIENRNVREKLRKGSKFTAVVASDGTNHSIEAVPVDALQLLVGACEEKTVNR